MSPPHPARLLRDATIAAARARALSDAGALGLAVAIAAGAAHPVAVPVALPVLVVAASFLVRRPWLLVLGAAVLSSALAAAAIAGASPAPARAYRGAAVLVSDPDEAFGSVRADVRVDGHRYELWARGRAARTLRTRLAGESIVVDGEVSPRRDGMDWLLRRHIVGRLTVDTVAAAGDGDPVSRVANALRRVLDRGATAMAPDERALFNGFVLGDDRFERAEVIDDFRASGLSHLLVVSGSNVAFILVLARPAVARVGLRLRLVLVVGVLLFFALLTRFEPSVLRATAMAVVATWATTIGRQISATRVLSLAVGGLLLVDPLLIGSVGFLLSIAASLGIILLARPLTRRLPGPRRLAELAGVTLAAQIGVAPVLVPMFGGEPVVALPANLLAVPAAGPVMVWGLTGGLAAGLLGGRAATVLHLPTRALLGWVHQVAARAADLPLGQVRAPHLAAIGLGLALTFVAARSRHGRAARLVGTAVVASALVVAAVGPAGGSAPRTELARGATLWRGAHGGTVLVVDARVDLAAILGALRDDGVRAVDLLVARSAGRRAVETVRVLRDRLNPRLVFVPEGVALDGAVTPPAGTEVVVDGIALVVTAGGVRLEVAVAAATGGEDARSVTGVAPVGVGSPGARPVRPDPPGGRAVVGPGARGPPVRPHAPGRGDRRRGGAATGRGAGGPHPRPHDR